MTAIKAENDSARPLATSNVSARIALPNAWADRVLLNNMSATSSLHYRFGDVTVVANRFVAGVGDPIVPPSTAMEIEVPRGSTYIACILDAGVATAEIGIISSVMP
jgi:hypothetical protein